jgi:hypothetical protein
MASGLRADAPEWKPAQHGASSTAAESVGDPQDVDPHGPTDDQPPHFVPHSNGAAYQHQQEYGTEYDDEDDDFDDTDSNMAWAMDQARRLEEARVQGQFYNDPTSADQQQNFGGYRPPRSFVPPGVTVGGAGLPSNAPAWYPAQQQYDAMSASPETVMTTATSIQVGVSVPKQKPPEKRRNYAKEQAKAVRRETIAVKSGLEAFSAALLQSVSPFMASLRKQTGSSLPHLKLDQRFGKRGQPHTAPAQFVIAPLVNYRPAHFHDLAPGDVMEFHFDLAQVLRVLSSSTCLCINYGPEWKQFTIPYAYLACANYAAEVKKLCPDEVPNGKADTVADGDITKDVTALLLAVPELEVFKRKNFVAALRSRVNLYPMYAVFAQLFSDIKNYQIQIRDLTSVPPQFLLRTNTAELQSVGRPIVISGSSELWDLMPVVVNTFCTTAGRIPTVGAARKQQPAAPAVVSANQPQVAPLPVQPANVVPIQPVAATAAIDNSAATDKAAAEARRQLAIAAALVAVTGILAVVVLITPFRKRR